MLRPQRNMHMHCITYQGNCHFVRMYRNVSYSRNSASIYQWRGRVPIWDTLALSRLRARIFDVLLLLLFFLFHYLINLDIL